MSVETKLPRYVWSTQPNSTLIHVCQGMNHTGRPRIGRSWTSPCWSITLTYWAGCDYPWDTPPSKTLCPACFSREQLEAWDRTCCKELAQIGGRE